MTPLSVKHNVAMRGTLAARESVKSCSADKGSLTAELRCESYGILLSVSEPFLQGMPPKNLH